MAHQEDGPDIIRDCAKHLDQGPDIGVVHAARGPYFGRIPTGCPQGGLHGLPRLLGPTCI